MTNVTGAYPIDPATPTGLFRTELGDIVGVPAEPPTDPQTAEYQYISDAAISALIVAYAGNPDAAMAKAITSMATQMIAAAQDIQVDDIRIKTVERATAMLEYATTLGASASASDAASAFSVVALTSANDYGRARPQGQPMPTGPSGF